jgi:hypothetical protein
MKTFDIENEPKIVSGFTTPDNYFDDFSQRLMMKLPENETKTISIFAKRKTWIYAAAAVLVLGISIPVVNQLSSKSTEIDDAVLENYIANNTTISGNDLVELLDETDVQQMNLDMKIDDKSIENELTTNNNLEQYLVN